MSKIKLIIEIEKRTYELIKDKPDNTAESIIANGIPYNPSGDLISREDLIKTIEKEEGISWNSHGKDDLCVRKKYIDNALTVEPERPKGGWGKWIVAEIQCPNCYKYLVQLDDNIKMLEISYIIKKSNKTLRYYCQNHDFKKTEMFDDFVDMQKGDAE